MGILQDLIQPSSTFYQWILQVAFIIVAIVTLRSLSVLVAIAGSAIVPMVTAKKPEKYPLIVPGKSIKPTFRT